MARWSKVRASGVALACGVVAVGGCARREVPKVRARGPFSAVSAAPVQALASAESRACEPVLVRLGTEAALPGSALNSGFGRALVLGRARAEPVVFSRAP